MSSRQSEIEALYRDQGRELWAIFYAQCCDRELAMDALHEAIVRFCAHDGATVRDLRAWLVRVGLNWLRDASRRDRCAPRGTYGLEDAAGSDPEPHAAVAAEELRSKLREVFASLDQADREVLVLRYALGWESKRIAASVQSTVGAVDMRISRARRRYADALEAAGVTREAL